ncbi:unnamed protein product [Phaedon cochleariae]|uniref:PHD-type domain-containing protein n=1 Tax=Phaedon cochleariae TaxID=80249 RepID=A0A9N9SKM2_PHACE|nr:unnamed protein product [Phaedon cochleariae]
MSNCHACTKSIPTTDRQAINCSVCRSRWHGVCARPQPVDVEKDTLSNWRCEKCPAPSHDTLDLSTQRFNAILAQFSTLNNSITTTNNKIEELTATITAHSERIESCVVEIASLRDDNKFLKTKIVTLENELLNMKSNANQIHAEISDRISRERNILIMGLVEGNTAEDLVLANDILSKITNGIAINNIQRLGKVPTDGKKRPLKVTLASFEDVLSVLRNKSKLPRDSFPTISIKPDSTPAQIKHLSELRKELQTRLEAGQMSDATSSNHREQLQHRDDDRPTNYFIDSCICCPIHKEDAADNSSISCDRTVGEAARQYLRSAKERSVF